MRLVPGWLRDYRRDWLGHDLVAGIVVWSVVVPQAVAYAQIAGLPPQAGLMAAPGALIAYALLGTSRTLVVSATTATAAVSAAAVGRIAQGDTAQFAALSAALALLSALVFAGAGFLHLGGVTDLISKPVMTGFLFGLGLTIAVGQLPKLFGVPGGSGDFFEKLWALLTQLDDTSGLTLAVGVVSVVLLVALARFVPAVPATLVVLVLSIAASALLDFSAHGVDVVGKLPSAYPHLSWPDVSRSDALELLPAAFGVLLLSTEGLGVARTIATAQGRTIDANREFVALGGSNALAGLSQGFVQCGGSSQTMAALRAGGETQLASLVGAGLILLTGAFLTGFFKDLPQATLGAIVIVAIVGLLRVDEIERFARVRPSAALLALVTVFGVLLLGVLPGLIVAAGLALVIVIHKLSRPELGTLGRDPESGAWGRIDRHPGWETTPGFLLARVDGPLFYANAVNIKERLLALARSTEPKPRVVVLDLAESPDLDIETLDALGELADTLATEGVELRLATVRARALELLDRAGLRGRIRVEPTLDAAVAS
jgi:SulP family sulfate permease